MRELAAAVMAALIMLSFWLVWRLRQRIRRLEDEKRRLEGERAHGAAVLATVPAALYRWDRTGESFEAGPISALRGLAGPCFAELTGLVAESDRERFEASVAGLRASGTGFAMPLHLAAGGQLDAVGSRCAGADLVWLADAVARTELDRVRRESERLRQVLDALPYPVWRRRADTLVLLDANRAYGQAVEAAPAQAIAESREIGATALGEEGRALADRARRTGVAQSESHHIVVGGQRRLRADGAAARRHQRARRLRPRLYRS